MGSQFLVPILMMGDKGQEISARDKTREHCITKFITSTIQINKPEDVDFADWIQDGIILTNLITTLDFNSISRDPWAMCNGGSSSEDLRVENLIEGFKNYGVQPKFLFTVQDLLDKYNIPKVVRCLEEVEKLAIMETHVVYDVLPSDRVYY